MLDVIYRVRQAYWGSLLSWAICMTFDSVTVLQKWSKKKPLWSLKMVLKNKETCLPAFWGYIFRKLTWKGASYIWKIQGIKLKMRGKGFYVVNQCQGSILLSRWCEKTEREHWRDWDFRMLFLNAIASDRMKLIPGWSWF